MSDEESVYVVLIAKSLGVPVQDEQGSLETLAILKAILAKLSPNPRTKDA